MKFDGKTTLFDALDSLSEVPGPVGPAASVVQKPASAPVGPGPTLNRPAPLGGGIEAVPVYDSEMEALDAAFTAWYDAELALLRRYAILTENPADLVDRHQHPQLLAKLSFAFRRSGDVLGRLKAQQRKAEGWVKRASALAGMDDLAEHVAQAAIKGQTVKVTDDYRKTFVAGSPRIYNANLRCAMLEGMTEQIWTMKLEFREAIQTLRAMSYGTRGDADTMSSTATASMEPV